MGAFGHNRPMGNNLKALRKTKNWSQERAAEALGTTRNYYVKLESGSRRLSTDWIDKAAALYGVDPGDIISESHLVPLVGYVGAGAEAHIFAEGQGPFGEVTAPDGSNENTVAVEIRGESLGSFFDQWLVFYDDVRDPPTAKMLGKLCIVGVADGRILIKKLMRGGIPGQFNLLSQFEPPIYDVIVDWAAIVKAMVPR